MATFTRRCGTAFTVHKNCHIGRNEHLSDRHTELIPDGLVVRIRRSHRRGRGSIPRLGVRFLSEYFSFMRHKNLIVKCFQMEKIKNVKFLAGGGSRVIFKSGTCHTIQMSPVSSVGRASDF